MGLIHHKQHTGAMRRSCRSSYTPKNKHGTPKNWWFVDVSRFPSGHCQGPCSVFGGVMVMECNLGKDGRLGTVLIYWCTWYSPDVPRMGMFKLDFHSKPRKAKPEEKHYVSNSLFFLQGRIACFQLNLQFPKLVTIIDPSLIYFNYLINIQYREKYWTFLKWNILKFVHLISNILYIYMYIFLHVFHYSS